MILGRNCILLVVLIILGFLLPRLIPGSPLSFSGEEINVLNLRLPEETFNRFRDYYVPEQPLVRQFAIYMSHLFNGDWGYSFRYGLPVKKIIMSRVSLTLFLSLTSIAISTIIAIPLGTFLALRRRGRGEKGILMLLLAVQTIPAFLLAIICRLFFAYNLGWFPAFGAYPPGMTPTDAGFAGHFILHAFLPVTVLVVSTVPPVAILTRNVVHKIKREPYVEAAYYFGIREKTIQIYYILLNSFPEIMGRLNIIFLYAIAGALFVEIIFSYPGMGTLMKAAVESRDYPLIQGIFLVTTIYSIAINFVFEVFSDKINPRLVT
jgi:peptide/nickel transport system permease protein